MIMILQDFTISTLIMRIHHHIKRTDAKVARQPQPMHEPNRSRAEQVGFINQATYITLN